MTVQTSGTLILTASDFKITHLGVELGLKCIDSQFSKVLAWAPKSDGTLTVVLK